MSRFLHERYQKLQAYTPGEQPRDEVFIKLNTNESPYPPAPSVAQAVTEREIALLRLYSDPTGWELKQKLAAAYGVAPEMVFLSNGSDEALNFAFMAYGGNGAVFPDISYGFYQVFAQLYQIPYEKIPLKEDFSIDIRDYCGREKMVVIANPNAPTGLGLPLEDLERVVSSNPDSLVLIDEAYVDFGGETALPLLQRYDNLLIVRTFSKSRCLAGGRLGYAFGRPEVIADLEKIKYATNPYNLDRLTLRLGVATVEAEPYYRQLCRQIQTTREWTTRQLEAMGFRVLPSQANFVFATTPRIDGQVLYQALKDRGILVRHFRDPRICQFNRITIGTPEQMQSLVDAVREILEVGYEKQ